MAKNISYCETGLSAPTGQITAYIYSYRLRHRHTNITIINKYLKCVYAWMYLCWHVHTTTCRNQR